MRKSCATLIQHTNKRDIDVGIKFPVCSYKHLLHCMGTVAATHSSLYDE